MSVDFSQLAPPDMIETIDYEVILDQRKNDLINKYTGDEKAQITEVLNRESEPLTKFLEENAYRETVLRNRINTSARATLLAFATGNDLDQIGANFNVKRLIIIPADNTKTPPIPAVYESDDAFRERIQLAFDSLSVAGPEAAYKKIARDSDGRVGDVTVVSPQPAYITLTVLQADSQTGSASPELIQIVKNAVNEEDKRPIGDRVTVQSAEIINYSIDAKLFIGKDPEAATLLQQAIKNVNDYATKQKRLGRSIRLSAIYAALHIDGVSRVELNSPTTDVVLTPYEASFCTNISVIIGGVE
ncbi:baseplate assembly protein [Acinetobacter ursingii]|uniref:baseplate assembly protein n=1 Tax=Acinetobacter ursingii TaxID=108980 RepID=UPI001250A8C8|nr:baseplate J/gp47 family protein [Acinetobacter ursingii]MCU4482249.1 baseplate J/gp47 family protein [Acinetobacter ursingii]MCU4506442.1 baseplate J/gp47 family protein [Acinetobacter ursingii]